MDNKWLFNSLFEYFDFANDKNNIYKYSEQIGKFTDYECNTIYSEISNRIVSLIDSILNKDDTSILFTISPIVNDLYRTMTSVTYFSDIQYDYLKSTAGSLFSYLRSKGIYIHFTTNNTFEYPNMIVKMFPLFLEACDFLLIDSYSYAKNVFEHVKDKDVTAPDEFDKIFADDKLAAVVLNGFVRNNKEAIEKVLNDMCEVTQDNHRNYVLIAPDSNMDNFSNYFECIGKPGIITIFKDEDSISSKTKIFPFTRR